MESPAGGSAAAEPGHPGTEPELPAPCPPEAAAGVEAAEGAPRARCLRAVYVLNEPPKGGAGARSPEAGARQCLLRACEAEGAQLGTVNFGELDFGETAVLDAFYDAGEGDGAWAGGGWGRGEGSEGSLVLLLSCLATLVVVFQDRGHFIRGLYNFVVLNCLSVRLHPARAWFPGAPWPRSRRCEKMSLPYTSSFRHHRALPQ